MAKPHKLAWNGVDIETALQIEHIANMAQRSAAESTGDLLRGKHRIVSVKSGDREIEFRINDFLISFNKLMVFTLSFTPSGGRVFATTTIDWFLATQTTVAGFIPVSTKSMVAHHTYMQFASNLAAQVREADPSAIITLREGAQAQPTSSAESPPANQDRQSPVTRTAPAPAPPGQPAPAFSSAVPPVPPPPAKPQHVLAPVPPPPSPPGGLITGIPGAPSYAPPAQPAASAATAPIASHTPAGLAPQAAQLFTEDEDLESTRMAQSGAAARPWVLGFPDGRSITLGPSIVIGRDPLAPNSSRAISIDDPLMSLSKTHAALATRDGLLWVTDLHSTNGTSVTNSIGEATPCPPEVDMPVGDGWTIQAGEISITATLGDIR